MFCSVYTDNIQYIVYNIILPVSNQLLCSVYTGNILVLFQMYVRSLASRQSKDIALVSIWRWVDEQCNNFCF
jgi:hypothetical protein